MATSIVVSASARDLTVQPTRVAFRVNSGDRSLRWLPAGNGVSIEAITFASGAPIEGPTQGTGGEWVATWHTDGQQEQLWKYSVTVAINGNLLPEMDPEVENGPPSGGMEEDEEDDGKW